MSSDSEPQGETPRSLIPPPDTIRPPQPTITEFPPAPSPLAYGASPGAPSPPPRSQARSLPPMPEVRPLLDLAAAAFDRRDWEVALEHYRKALFVLPPEDGAIQASIYASVGEVKLAQAKLREAETNFEKALLVDPGDLRAIDGLISIATREGDWPRVALARRRRAEAFEDPDDKAAELCVIADIEETKLAKVDEAIASLEVAASHRPDHVGISMKLRDLYLATRAWKKLLDILDRLVRASSEPRSRGAFRFAQADVALGRLREEPRGLAFLEMALDEDPECDRALSALVAVRTRREEWAELATVYERLVDRYGGLGDRDRAWEVCRRLGTLRRDRLLDGPGAIAALRGAVELRPDDVESRAALAELYAAKGERAAAVRELETAAAVAPLRAQTYRRLFELHQRAERPDRAWLAATCLEELGASDVAQDLAIEQFRPEGPIRPTTALHERWWDELLAAQGADAIIGDVLLTIGDAAISLKLEELASRRKLAILDPAAKQDASSTASVVRTFVWGARALGVPLPDLYVRLGVPNGIAAVAAARPSTALGQAVLAGRSVQQLAFFVGRHLTYYRPAHYPLVFFPTLAELSTLVLSAVRVVIPGISLPPTAEGDDHVVRGLGARLSETQRQRLAELLARLDARGGRLDLLGWIRSVELTAARAGLLLAGDLRVAMRLMKEEERSIGELSSEAKRGDLLSYCASEAYARLRERMGVAIRPGPSASIALAGRGGVDQA